MGNLGRLNERHRLLAPKPGTEFRVHKGRLALYHETADDQEYWTEYWTEASVEADRRRAANGHLGYFEQAVHLLPRDQPILDAGCSTAQVVGVLRNRGFDAWGVDYAAGVVERAREVFPDARIEQQDVTALDVADGSIGAYVSLGIVEHFEEGPDAALAEARRVLRPDGVAIVSVPSLNAGRARLLADLERRGQAPTDKHFHQYYLGVADMADAMDRAGLRLVEHHGAGATAYLKREKPAYSRWYWSKACPDRLKPRVSRVVEAMPPSAQERWAHMMMFVARPI